MFAPAEQALLHLPKGITVDDSSLKVVKKFFLTWWLPTSRDLFHKRHQQTLLGRLPGVSSGPYSCSLLTDNSLSQSLPECTASVFAFHNVLWWWKLGSYNSGPWTSTSTKISLICWICGIKAKNEISSDSPLPRFNLAVSLLNYLLVFSVNLVMSSAQTTCDLW